MEKQNSCYLEVTICKWHVEQIRRVAGRKYLVSPLAAALQLQRPRPIWIKTKCNGPIYMYINIILYYCTTIYDGIYM